MSWDEFFQMLIAISSLYTAYCAYCNRHNKK